MDPGPPLTLPGGAVSWGAVLVGCPDGTARDLRSAGLPTPSVVLLGGSAEDCAGLPGVLELVGATGGRLRLVAPLGDERSSAVVAAWGPRLLRLEVDAVSRGEQVPTPAGAFRWDRGWRRVAGG